MPQLAPSRPCPLPCLPRRPLRVTACTAMPPQRHTREASTHSAQRQQQAAGNILPFRRPSGADAGAGAAAGAGRAPAAQPLPEWRLHLAHSPSADVERLSLQPEGWNTWNWRGHRVNWVGAGGGATGSCHCCCRGWLRGGRDVGQLPAILSRVWLAHVLLLPTVPTLVHAFTHRHCVTRPPTYSLFTNPPAHQPSSGLQRPGRHADPRSPPHPITNPCVHPLSIQTTH